MKLNRVDVKLTGPATLYVLSVECFTSFTPVTLHWVSFQHYTAEHTTVLAGVKTTTHKIPILPNTMLPQSFVLQSAARNPIKKWNNRHSNVVFHSYILPCGVWFYIINLAPISNVNSITQSIREWLCCCRHRVDSSGRHVTPPWSHTWQCYSPNCLQRLAGTSSVSLQSWSVQRAQARPLGTTGAQNCPLTLIVSLTTMLCTTTKSCQCCNCIQERDDLQTILSTES